MSYPSLTPTQKSLTAKGFNRDGLVRVGWYGQGCATPHHVAPCRHAQSGWGTHGFPTREAAMTAGHPSGKCCAEFHIDSKEN